MSTPTLTLEYKTSPIPVQLDVYSPPSTVHSTTPCLLYFHLGALYYGNRKAAFPEWLVNECGARGWTFISADYRLLPESKIDDVMQDVKDAWKFIHTDLSAKLVASKLSPIDVFNVFLSGASAGGYLTLQGGHMLSPPPKALVSFYGYTFNNEWYWTPQNPDTEIMGYKVGRTEAHEDTLKEYWREGKAPVSWRKLEMGDLESTEALFFTWQIYRGTYFSNTFGIPSRDVLLSHPEKHHLFPEYAITSSSHYPPLMLTHGSGDTPIPYTDSVRFATWLKERGREVELLVLDGREHCWDLEDGDELAEEGRRKVWEFLEKHVGVK